MTTRPRILLAAVVLCAAALAALAGAAQAAGGWAPATRLAEGASTQPGGVAIAPDGTVVTAFQRTQAGTSSHVEVAVKPPYGSFGPPQRLSTTGTAHSPRLVGDDAGNVAIVWLEQVAGTPAVRGATRPAGGAFGPAQTISDTGTSADFPRLDLADGIAVVAWAQGGRVRAATAPAGSPFQVHHPLSANVGFHDAPVVAVGAGGAAVAAWYTVKAGPHSTLHAAGRSGTGEEFAALGDVAQFDGVRSHIRLSASPEGRATLAWTFWDDATDRYLLQSASRGRTGEFGGVETVDAFATGGGGYIALDTGPDGTSALMWHDVQTRYAVRPDGGGFGPTRTVPGSTSAYYVPELRFSADGSARGVWRGYRLGRSNVESARIGADGTSGPAEVIAAPATQPEMVDAFEGLYGLALDPRGNAAVTWSHFADVAPGPATDHRRAVEVRIFDREPPSVRRVTVPPTGITGVSVPMSAVANDPLTPVTVRWKLGKYLTAQGAAIAPVYDEPGDHFVGIEAVDGGGNVTSTSRTIRVTPNPNPCPPGEICG